MSLPGFIANTRHFTGEGGMATKSTLGKKKAGAKKATPAHHQPGIVLHEWRKERNFPLKRVAKDLGVSLSVVCQWERAIRYPGMENLIKIADYVGVPVSRLFCLRKDCPNA
jgi:hypothetical protein